MALHSDSFFVMFNQVSRDLKIYHDILGVIGLYYVGKVAFSFAWSVFQGFKAHIACRMRPLADLRLYGEWAVVTGCTSGIGESYATELARRGMNIVLVSRGHAKLKKLARTLELEFGIETSFIDVDFSRGAEIYDHISKSLDKLDVGILVNNVGVISPQPMYVNEMTKFSIWEHVNVNVAAATMMTHIILPKMIAKNTGAIVNMSSLAAIGPTPLLAVYSATKVYIDYFSRALHEELSDTDIVVQTLTPSYINTRMVSYSKQLRNSGPLVPSPSLYAKHALYTLGSADVTTGYWLHGIQAWLFSCFPSSAWIYSARYLNKFYRKQALAEYR